MPLLLTLILLGLAASRLFSYRRQMTEMARVLEETPAESNLPLTVQMTGAPARRLCRAINARLEASRLLWLEALRGERELKYTMACISHDIRTPLAGAMGYLQLLNEEPQHQQEYLRIVTRRLEELNELLDELFLYTRLLNNAFSPECKKTAALLPLWDALAEFYPQLEAAGIQPHIRFDKDELQVWANLESLGRVYRNLIANAIRHGGGGLTISAAGNEICFSNPLGTGPRPEPDHLFDRFYQSGPAHGKGGAGLGLSIVRELMEQMDGQVSAQIIENELQIKLIFLS